MNRALLLLTLAVGGLFLWDRMLISAAGDERAARSRVGLLIPAAEREAMPIASLRLEIGDTALRYGRIGGQWRCIDFHRAFATGSTVESLINKLTRAQGFVVSDNTDEARTYGINTPQMVRVMVCGPGILDDPGHDALATFDVGASVPERDGAFVRLRGSKEVWAVDSNPRIELTPHAPGLPPLLDPAVVPAAWPGWKSGLVRIFVDHTGGAAYELQRRAVDVPPEELQRGRMPWAWIVDPGANELPAAMLQSHAYSLFLARAPFVGLLGAEERETLVAYPTTVLTLVAPETEPLALEIGTPLGNGRVPVWNPWSETVLLLAPEVAALLVPSRQLLTTESEENPWDPYLR